MQGLWENRKVGRVNSKRERKRQSHIWNTSGWKSSQQNQHRELTGVDCQTSYRSDALRTAFYNENWQTGACDVRP